MAHYLDSIFLYNDYQASNKTTYLSLWVCIHWVNPALFSGQSINRSVGNVVSQSISQLVIWSVSQFVSWSCGQSVNPSVGHVVSQSIGQLVMWSVSQSTTMIMNTIPLSISVYPPSWSSTPLHSGLTCIRNAKII